MYTLWFMHETITQATTLSQDYRATLRSAVFKNFTTYYGNSESDPRSKSGIKSDIRFVDAYTTNMLVSPQGLPKRSVESLIWGAFGQQTKAYAEEVGIAFNTARTHRGYLFMKLGATSMTQAICIGFQQRKLQPTLEAATHLQLTLTDKEHDVLSVLGQGNTNEEAAAVLGVSYNTIRTHAYNILTSNDVRNMTHALTVAFLSEQIPLPQ